MFNVMDGGQGTVFGLTSLDPSETNGQRLRDLGPRVVADLSDEDLNPNPSRFSYSPAQAQIHQRHKRDRDLIIDSLDNSTFGPIGRQRERMRMCGFAPLFVLRDDGTVTVAPGLCRCRMCPTCQHRRGREMTARVHAITATMNAPRFLTLTVRSSTDSLKHQLDRLYAWFRDLRRRELWKAHVKGGVAVCEVTWNHDTEQWHPHLHVLIDGTYIPQSALAREWLDITKTSSVVDIRAVHDRRSAAHYVAAYVAKPAAVAAWPAACINEFAFAMHGRRLLVCFGACHRVVIPEDECETRPAVVEPLCSHQRLMRAAAANCPAALHAQDLLKRVGGFASIAAGCDRPRPLDVREPLADFEWEWLAEALRFVAQNEPGSEEDAVPFANADTIAASPPRARAASPAPPTDARATLRIDTPTRL